MKKLKSSELKIAKPRTQRKSKVQSDDNESYDNVDYEVENIIRDINYSYRRFESDDSFNNWNF